MGRRLGLAQKYKTANMPWVPHRSDSRAAVAAAGLPTTACNGFLGFDCGCAMGSELEGLAAIAKRVREAAVKCQKHYHKNP